jgi:hypothetical protein
MIGIRIQGCRYRSTPGYNLSSLSGFKEAASPRRWVAAHWERIPYTGLGAIAECLPVHKAHRTVEVRSKKLAKECFANAR